MSECQFRLLLLFFFGFCFIFYLHEDTTEYIVNRRQNTRFQEMINEFVHNFDSSLYNSKKKLYVKMIVGLVPWFQSTNGVWNMI